MLLELQVNKQVNIDKKWPTMLKIFIKIHYKEKVKIWIEAIWKMTVKNVCVKFSHTFLKVKWPCNDGLMILKTCKNCFWSQVWTSGCAEREWWDEKTSKNIIYKIFTRSFTRQIYVWLYLCAIESVEEVLIFHTIHGFVKNVFLICLCVFYTIWANRIYKILNYSRS